MADATSSTPQRRRTRVNGLAVLGFGLLALLAICALFAPWIAPYDPNAQDYRAVLQAPSVTHWLGTDHTGRDMLSRLIHGSRVALGIGFTAIGRLELIEILKRRAQALGVPVRFNTRVEKLDDLKADPYGFRSTDGNAIVIKVTGTTWCANVTNPEVAGTTFSYSNTTSAITDVAC